MSSVAATRLPHATELFRRRSSRLEALAGRSSTADYLQFLARLVSAQRSAAECIEVPIAAGTGARPLDPVGLERTSAWRVALRQILSTVGDGSLPDASRAAIEVLALAPVERLEALAEDVLFRSLKSEDAALAPFIAASLQVYWSHLASRLQPQELARDPIDGGCPACGSPPVAGFVATGAPDRYLSCSLCSTEWHLARIQCAACGSTAKISHYEVEGAAGVVTAEACDDCRTYVKLFNLDMDGDAEPHADDLATLPLDMLMADSRYQRAGPNLLLPSAR